MNPRRIVLTVGAMMLAGCAAAPRSGAPASPAAQPAIAGTVVVFPVAGDSGEALSTIAEPLVRARRAPQAVSADSDTSISPSDTASDPGAHASPPPALSQAAPPAPAPAQTSAAIPRAGKPGTSWIQLFAGNSRAAAFAEAQRAVRVLSVREEDVQISQDPKQKLWKVRLAQSLSTRSASWVQVQKYFPKAYEVDDMGFPAAQR